MKYSIGDRLIDTGYPEFAYIFDAERVHLSIRLMECTCWQECVAANVIRLQS
jgi:hypothetical protein